jgi:hypothetical protein
MDNTDFEVIQANALFAAKAVNLHNDLASLVRDLAARWDHDDAKDAPELTLRLEAIMKRMDA